MEIKFEATKWEKLHDDNKIDFFLLILSDKYCQLIKQLCCQIDEEEEERRRGTNLALMGQMKGLLCYRGI